MADRLVSQCFQTTAPARSTSDSTIGPDIDPFDVGSNSKVAANPVWPVTVAGSNGERANKVQPIPSGCKYVRVRPVRGTVGLPQAENAAGGINGYLGSHRYPPLPVTLLFAGGAMTHIEVGYGGWTEVRGSRNVQIVPGVDGESVCAATCDYTIEYSDSETPPSDGWSGFEYDVILDFINGNPGDTAPNSVTNYYYSSQAYRLFDHMKWLRVTGIPSGQSVQQYVSDSPTTNPGWTPYNLFAGLVATATIEGAEEPINVGTGMRDVYVPDKTAFARVMLVASSAWGSTPPFTVRSRCRVGGTTK